MRKVLDSNNCFDLKTRSEESITSAWIARRTEGTAWMPQVLNFINSSETIGRCDEKGGD